MTSHNVIKLIKSVLNKDKKNTEIYFQKKFRMNYLQKVDLV